MSKADEMFKKLGYEKDETPCDFFGEKIPYIRYHDYIHYKTISFNLKDKFMSTSCINKDYLQVLQAINEKCKELGWYE